MEEGVRREEKTESEKEELRREGRNKKKVGRRRKHVGTFPCTFLHKLRYSLYCSHFVYFNEASCVRRECKCAVSL